SVIGAVKLFRRPLISAPEAEQSAVGPFFDIRNPVWGSALFGFVARSAALVFSAVSPSLSGRPMPRSQAAVTILLPAGNGAQSAAVPTKANGTARSSSSSPANAGTAGMSARIAKEATSKILNIIVLLSFVAERLLGQQFAGRLDGSRGLRPRTPAERESGGRYLLLECLREMSRAKVNREQVAMTGALSSLPSCSPQATPPRWVSTCSEGVSALPRKHLS